MVVDDLEEREEKNDERMENENKSGNKERERKRKGVYGREEKKTQSKEKR